MNLVGVNDITRMVAHFNLTKIYQLHASTIFKKDDLEIAVSMFLCKVVMIGVGNISHQERACTILKVVHGQLIDMGNGAHGGKVT